VPASAALPSHLRAGYGRFRSGRYAAERERYRELGEAGQRPTTMIVACSDSRAAPEAVFDAGPGQVFVVRNVAGLVPVYEPDGHAHAASAALEYAVLALGVSDVVVLGHGHCGGIAAALDPGAPLSATDFIGTWVTGLRALAEELEPVSSADPDDLDDRRTALERRSVERSLDNLRTFPWIRAREAAGELRVHGAWFDIGVGELHELGPDGWTKVEPPA
jgi:carbonic anhydrase